MVREEGVEGAVVERITSDSLFILWNEVVLTPIISELVPNEGRILDGASQAPWVPVSQCVLMQCHPREGQVCVGNVTHNAPALKCVVFCFV